MASKRKAMARPAAGKMPMKPMAKPMMKMSTDMARMAKQMKGMAKGKH